MVVVQVSGYPSLSEASTGLLVLVSACLQLLVQIFLFTLQMRQRCEGLRIWFLVFLGGGLCYIVLQC